MYGFWYHFLSGAREAPGGGQRRTSNGPSAFVNGLKDVDGPGGIRDGPQVLEGQVKSGINLTVMDRGRTPGGSPRWLAAARHWPECFCDRFERCRPPQVVEATPGGSGKAGHRPDMGQRPGGGRWWLAVASGGPGSELSIDSQLQDIVYPRHVTNSLIYVHNPSGSQPKTVNLAKA
jgi:hypothetical protein